MPVETRGLTPCGGDRAVAFFFDAAGDEVEPADATRGEIIEYLDDIEVRRTYLDLEGKDWSDASLVVPDNVSFDLAPESQDLLKYGTWDLWHIDDAGQWLHPVETLAELLQVLEASELPLPDQRRAVGQLMGLPAWTPAPQALKDEVGTWMVSTRQE